MKALLPVLFATVLAGCSNLYQAGGMSMQASANDVLGVHGPSERILHFFSGRPDGALPITGRLTIDAAGNLYGATNTGGSGTCEFRGTITGCGTVYELTPTGSSWSERVLYSFKDLGDGAGPWGTVTLDGNGNVYGVTMAGGNHGCVPLFWAYHGCGTAFELVRKKGTWKKRTLHVFSGGTDGGNPAGSVVLDSLGNLYGTAICGGGTYSCYTEGEGDGVFFQLKPTSRTFWNIHVLHAFQRVRLGGVFPKGDLTIDSAGHIYGMAENIYEMARSGSRWHYKQLILLGNNSFAQGRNPTGGPVFDAAGNAYGMMSDGGDVNCNCGLVFEASRSPSGTYAETVLHTFTGGADGGLPEDGLTIDASGLLYGTTANGGDTNCNNGGGCGVAFTLQAAGSKSVERVLHIFKDNVRDGALPSTALDVDRAGNIYGSTAAGGPGRGIGLGSAFEITP